MKKEKHVDKSFHVISFQVTKLILQEYIEFPIQNDFFSNGKSIIDLYGYFKRDRFRSLFPVFLSFTFLCRKNINDICKVMPVKVRSILQRQTFDNFRENAYGDTFPKNLLARTKNLRRLFVTSIKVNFQDVVHTKNLKILVTSVNKDSVFKVDNSKVWNLKTLVLLCEMEDASDQMIKYFEKLTIPDLEKFALLKVRVQFPTTSSYNDHVFLKNLLENNKHVSKLHFMGHFLQDEHLIPSNLRELFLTDCSNISLREICGISSMSVLSIRYCTLSVKESDKPTIFSKNLLKFVISLRRTQTNVFDFVGEVILNVFRSIKSLPSLEFLETIIMPLPIETHTLEKRICFCRRKKLYDDGKGVVEGILLLCLQELEEAIGNFPKEIFKAILSSENWNAFFLQSNKAFSFDVFECFDELEHLQILKISANFFNDSQNLSPLFKKGITVEKILSAA